MAVLLHITSQEGKIKSCWLQSLLILPSIAFHSEQQWTLSN